MGNREFFLLKAKLQQAPKLLEAPNNLCYLRRFWIGVSKATAVVLVVYTFCFQAINAEGGTKTPIALLHSGKDAIGIRLVYQIKEEIRKSASYRLSSIDEPKIIINLITMDMADELVGDLKDKGKNQKSVVMIVYTQNDNKGVSYYLHGVLLTCGKSVTKEQAETIVAMIER